MTGTMTTLREEKVRADIEKAEGRLGQGSPLYNKLNYQLIEEGIWVTCNDQTYGTTVIRNAEGHYFAITENRRLVGNILKDDPLAIRQVYPKERIITVYE